MDSGPFLFLYQKKTPNKNPSVQESQRDTFHTPHHWRRHPKERLNWAKGLKSCACSFPTWRIIPGIVSGSPSFIGFIAIKFGHLERGPITPGRLGDLRSPCLIDYLTNWDDPPSTHHFPIKAPPPKRIKTSSRVAP